jgi:pimeloyl-ACP methyl ester carboxylesterase
MDAVAPYQPRRVPVSHTTRLRGLDQHWLEWPATGGADSTGSTPAPLLVLLHGWMDVAASYQFMVDALDGQRRCVALDWRGFGQTRSGADTFWFADYLGDLDAWLQHLSPHAPVDLLGHSMGGNVVMIYAGVRPERIRRLINLEGFGMPSTTPSQAPARLTKWLDELRDPSPLRPYDSPGQVAGRLMKNNPLLSADKAAWLATHWAEPRTGSDGRTQWHILGEAAHKHVNPTLHRVEETLAIWSRIAAPVLWVEGDQTDVSKWWGNRYPRSEFDQRLQVVQNVERHRLAPCGHMLHHDQPEALAGVVQDFLAR